MNGKVCLSFPESVVISENAANLIERMIEFKPENRITIPEIKDNCWFQDGDTMFLIDPNQVCTYPSLFQFYFYFYFFVHSLLICIQACFGVFLFMYLYIVLGIIYAQVNGIDNNVLLDTVNIMGCGREDLIQSLIEGAHTEVSFGPFVYYL